MCQATSLSQAHRAVSHNLCVCAHSFVVCTLSLVTLEVWNYQHKRGRALCQSNSPSFGSVPNPGPTPDVSIAVPAPPAQSSASRNSFEPLDVLAAMEACEASDTQLDAVAERIVNTDTLQLVDIRNAMIAGGVAPRVVIRVIATLRARAAVTPTTARE